MYLLTQFNFCVNCICSSLSKHDIIFLCIPGSSDPRSVASAIRLFMLMKNWLNKKKIRKNDNNSSSLNNIYRDRNNEKTIPLAEKIKNTRESLDQGFLTFSASERRPCCYIIAFSHGNSKRLCFIFVRV
jgi:rRNA pseudouridine-1189 N-methylase Emg1 (Nep1/Mra1 family)